MSSGTALTLATFEAEVTASPIPVLVDFWAEWCMPCRMIAPHLDQLAAAYAGKVKIATIDVDAEPDLAARFNIISIPTLILFKGGQVVKQKVGALPKPEIENIFKDQV